MPWLGWGTACAPGSCYTRTSLQKSTFVGLLGQSIGVTAAPADAVLHITMSSVVSVSVMPRRLLHSRPPPCMFRFLLHAQTCVHCNNTTCHKYTSQLSVQLPTHINTGHESDAASLLFRWTQGLLKLLQQPLPSEEMRLAAAAVHAVSSMRLFVQHVQADNSLYFMLTQAAAHALHSGKRYAAIVLLSSDWEAQLTQWVQC